LGEIEVFNLSGEPTELLVKRVTYDVIPYAGFYRCDYPLVGPFVPMRQCATDSTGEPIAFRASLNDPACDPQAPCAEDCAGKPCVDFAMHQTPSLTHCPGDPVQVEMKIWNCSETVEDIQVFMNFEEIAFLAQVAPLDTVRVSHSYSDVECPDHHVTFSTVARNAVCPEPSGRLVARGTFCSETDCSRPPCPVVSLSGNTSSEVGDTVSVWVNTNRFTDLFGLSARASWDPTISLRAIGVQCVDEEGLPLDLGEGALCYGHIDNEQGIVDFGVSRRAGAFGVTGALRVARIEFTYDEGSEPDQCSWIRLRSPKAIDSFGRGLCVKEPQGAGRLCSEVSCTIWPGDTNNDGLVDEDDLVTLAAYWGFEGPARQGWGCFWTATRRDCWPERDATFSDAYGEGAVGSEDVLCIGANWGRFHPVVGKAVEIPEGVDRSAMHAALVQMLASLTHVDEGDVGMAAVKKALEDLVENGTAPARSRLGPNLPNPFNPSTRIRYDVAAESRVSLVVYDVAGRRVRLLVDQIVEPGRHAADWDGRDVTGVPVASGVYICRAIIGGESFSHKMVLTR
jgi:hypothetical protein